MRPAQIFVGAFLCAMAGLGLQSPPPAFAEKKVVTPVDEHGNPIGPSKEVEFPDNPTGGAVVQPVDKNGNPVGEPVVIPDAPASGGHQASPEQPNSDEPDAGQPETEPDPNPDTDPNLVPEE